MIKINTIMSFFKKKKTLEEAVKPISTHALSTLPYAEEMQVIHSDVNTDDAWDYINTALRIEEGKKNCGFVEILSDIYQAIPYEELISTLEFLGYSVGCLRYDFTHDDYNKGYVLRIKW